MISEEKPREFCWSRSSIFYPFAALVFWLLLAAAQLWSGNGTLAFALFILSGKWVYDCLWYGRHPYIELGKEMIRINRSPFRRQVIYWECIEHIEEHENSRLELFLYGGEVITISLLPLEFSQRNGFVITLRNALCSIQAAWSDRAFVGDIGKARQLLEKAEILFESGRFHKALPLLDEALRLHPEFDRCYLKRGLALFSCGCYEESIADYDQARQLNPHLAESYYYKALAIEKIGRTQEALESYQDFLRFAPPHYMTLMNAVRERIRKLQEETDS